MRLSSLRVDGFGVLAALEHDDLSPGLVVVVGPNEAGKSTLRDFVSGMLFGLASRRNDPQFRAPVRGGRHGGVLCFVDEQGGTWTIERYLAPERSTTVRLPDGRLGDEADLARVLGNASSGLFRSVFSIGLDELGTIDTTSTDEARELLFSSSIFGERQSAARAVRRLAEAASELGRPRQADARANRLARELDEARAQLQRTREEVAGYDTRKRELATLVAEMEARRADIRARRRRDRELATLIRCWPVAARAERAATERAELPGPDPLTGKFRDLAPELKELYAEFSGHEERQQRASELRRQKGGLEASMRHRFGRLGEGWTEADVRACAAPELLSDHVRELRRRLSECDSSVSAAAALLERAEADVREQGDSLVEHHPLPDSSVLRMRRDAVGELRERLAEVDALTAAAGAVGVGSVPRADLPRKLALAAAVGVFLLSAGAVALAARGEALLAGTCGLAAVVLAAVAAAGWRAGRPERAPARRPPVRTAHAVPAARAEAGTGSDGGATCHPPTGGASALERALHRADELAAQLGLPLPPSRVDAERLDRRLQAEFEARSAHDHQREWAAAAERRRADAQAKLAVARRSRAETLDAATKWTSDHGFRAGLSLDETLEAISVVTSLRDDMEALDRIGPASKALEAQVDTFERRCKLVARTLGWSDPPDEPAELGAFLQGLVDRMEELAVREGRRAALTSEISSASTELERSLGQGPDGERLRAELASGEIWQWQAELDDLTAALDQLVATDETAVRAHQSVTEALAELAGSDRVAVLEQSRLALEEELDGALRQFLVLSTARSLVQQTLARHQRERQPAVLAAAGEHFARVTAGRYAALVADDSPDDIKVITAAGAALDAASLSRGTLEQLYLCIRLGLARTFAERGAALPLVLDDVLVNFDSERARAVAHELATMAEHHQILFMTCHRHLADLMIWAAGDGPVQLVELARA